MICSRGEVGLYKLIFVDDEDIVREGITSRIPWGKNGFELAGVFGDGRAALDFVQENEVDVIIAESMNERAEGLFEKAEIKVVTGAFPLYNLRRRFANTSMIVWSPNRMEIAFRSQLGKA